MKYNEALETITLLKKTIKEQDGSIHALELIVRKQEEIIDGLKEFNELLLKSQKKKDEHERDKN